MYGKIEKYKKILGKLKLDKENISYCKGYIECLCIEDIITVEQFEILKDYIDELYIK